MAKGQKRSNRETRKPKKAPPPAPVQVGSHLTAGFKSAAATKPQKS